MTRLLQTKAFARDWKKLTPETRIFISLFLLRLSEDPSAVDIRRLQISDETLFRLRCGEYRVIFRKTMEGIELAKVAHRKDIYR